MKTSSPQKSRFYLVLLGLLCGLVLVPGAAWAQEKTAPEKKTGGVMWDPASKRGVEYGFDKGFEAGKADKDGGLKPDPTRHEDFNNPEKYFRSEFGSRAAFAQGFKSGFAGGYQKAFGKNVKISVPGIKTTAPGDEGTADKPIAKPVPATTGSDAL